MKSKKNFIVMFCLILSGLLLTGCASDQSSRLKKLDNPQFIKEITGLLNARMDEPEFYYSGDNPLIDLESEQVFEPYFYIKDLKTSEDPEDKSLIHYSCKIPGLVGAVYNIVYGKCFLNNEKYSPWVEVEGDVKIITDDEGNRKIDISDTRNINVFSTGAIMRYPDSKIFENESLFQKEGKLLPENITEKDISKGLPYIPVLSQKFRSLYSSMTGVTPDEYTQNIIAPEMDYYTEHFSEFSKKSNKSGYGLINWHNSLPWYFMVPLDILLFVVFLIVVSLVIFPLVSMILNMISPDEKRKTLRKKWNERVKGLDREEKKYLKNRNYKKIFKNPGFTDYKDTGRDAAIRNLTYPEDREMLRFLAEEEMNLLALEKLAYPEERDFLVSTIQRIQNDAYLRGRHSDVEMTIIAKLQYPADKDVLEKEARYANLQKVRLAALDKLQYPGSKVIEYIASSDPKPDVRLAAIKKLSYPEAKDSLARIARNSSYSDNREYAFEKLQFPADREAIMDCLLNQSYQTTPIKYFSYPEDREDLIKLAKEAQDDYARRAALRKLPYPEEKETLLYILENAEEGSLRDTIMEKIESSGDGQEILAETALKAGDAKTRLDALKKLDPAENRKVFQQAAQKDKNEENRCYAIEKLSFPEDRKLLVKIAQNDEDRGCRFLARRKLPFLEEPSAWVHEDMIGGQKLRYKNKVLNVSENEKLKSVIALTLSPDDFGDVLRDLCKMIQTGMRHDFRDTELTLAGWAAAALGKVLTAEMTPDDIEPNRKCFEKAIDRYNEVITKIRDVQQRLKNLEGLDIRYFSASQKKDYDEFKSLQSELDRGLGDYMLDNGDKPFTYLTHILRDNQSRVPRFIKQGVIMGLLDWLMANTEHPEAKELLDSVIAVRADLIRSDNELSFFEVRVPEDCTRDEYAQLLSMVLHSANPSIRYCSTKNLLALAEEEVPGCMEMLQQYPLRLIDQSNKRTLGFYKFEPYIHAMWVQYQPPKDTGKVISRYHEVDDRTRPLSSGLNLQLFRDLYSVIPTLFHEYQHFSGDPNEASVFLKTQVFSISFYKRHTTAKANRDAVFARLSELMGLPPAPDKCSELNSLIEQYYGKETTPAEAMAHADRELNRLNNMIYTINQREKWDPSVKFPLLIENEDKENRDLIRNIIIRWDKTPKSVTEKEFREITKI